MSGWFGPEMDCDRSKIVWCREKEAVKVSQCKLTSVSIWFTSHDGSPIFNIKNLKLETK